VAAPACSVHPAAILVFTGGTPMMLGNLALRLNGMY
jgi:hypothetical protein